jgi:spoIIIJ-associated protein
LDVTDLDVSPATASSDESAEADAAPSRGVNDHGLLVQEGDIAADYLEHFLDIVDYDGDIDLDVENDRAVVAIVGSDLQPLIGSRGATLDALQELTRLAVQQKTGVRSRLMLDVSGHRQERRAELAALAHETARSVLTSGSSGKWFTTRLLRSTGCTANRKAKSRNDTWWSYRPRDGAALTAARRCRGLRGPAAVSAAVRRPACPGE